MLTLEQWCEGQDCQPWILADVLSSNQSSQLQNKNRLAAFFLIEGKRFLVDGYHQIPALIGRNFHQDSEEGSQEQLQSGLTVKILFFCYDILNTKEDDEFLFYLRVDHWEPVDCEPVVCVQDLTDVNSLGTVQEYLFSCLYSVPASQESLSSSTNDSLNLKVLVKINDQSSEAHSESKNVSPVVSQADHLTCGQRWHQLDLSQSAIAQEDRSIKPPWLMSSPDSRSDLSRWCPSSTSDAPELGQVSSSDVKRGPASQKLSANENLDGSLSCSQLIRLMFNDSQDTIDPSDHLSIDSNEQRKIMPQQILNQSYPKLVDLIVPDDQRKILDALPGWTDSESQSSPEGNSSPECLFTQATLNEERSQFQAHRPTGLDRIQDDILLADSGNIIPVTKEKDNINMSLSVTKHGGNIFSSITDNRHEPNLNNSLSLFSSEGNDQHFDQDCDFQTGSEGQISSSGGGEISSKNSRVSLVVSSADSKQLADHSLQDLAAVDRPVPSIVPQGLDSGQCLASEPVFKIGRRKRNVSDVAAGSWSSAQIPSRSRDTESTYVSCQERMSYSLRKRKRCDSKSSALEEIPLGSTRSKCKKVLFVHLIDVIKNADKSQQVCKKNIQDDSSNQSTPRLSASVFLAEAKHNTEVRYSFRNRSQRAQNSVTSPCGRYSVGSSVVLSSARELKVELTDIMKENRQSSATRTGLQPKDNSVPSPFGQYSMGSSVVLSSARQLKVELTDIMKENRQSSATRTGLQTKDKTRYLSSESSGLSFGLGLREEQETPSMLLDFSDEDYEKDKSTSPLLTWDRPGIPLDIVPSSSPESSTEDNPPCFQWQKILNSDLAVSNLLSPEIIRPVRELSSTTFGKKDIVLNSIHKLDTRGSPSFFQGRKSIESNFAIVPESQGFVPLLDYPVSCEFESRVIKSFCGSSCY